MRKFAGVFLATVAIAALGVAWAGSALDPRDLGRPDPVAPRTDAINGWQTQEWPQRGQDAANRGCYTGEFTVAQTMSPNVTKAYPYGQWKNLTSRILGAPTTAYNQNILLATDRGASDIAGYGCMAVTVENPDGVFLFGHSGNFSYSFDYELLQGMPNTNGFFQTIGSFMGSPAIVPEPFQVNQGYLRRNDGIEYPFSYGFFYVMGGSSLGAGGIGLFFKWTAIVVASSGQLPGTKTSVRYHSSLAADATYGITDHLIENPVCIDGPFAFACNKGQVTYDGNGNVVSWESYAGALLRYNWDTPQLTAGQVPGGWQVVQRMEPDWTALLQIGSDDPRPLPKGQEPAYAAVRLNPVTSPAVRGDLAVIGAQRLERSGTFTIQGRTFSERYAIISFDSRTGVQRKWWMFNNKPVTTPIILKDRILFSTRNSMVFCLDLDLNLLWRSRPDDPLFQYRPRPISDAHEYAKVELSGMAVDSDEAYAYCGGTDGRVHRFAVGNGDHTASEVLWYYHHQTNANMMNVYRPCVITAPPAIYKNKSILVKTHTQKMETWGSNGNSSNASCLMILPLPDLTFTGGNIPMASGPGGCTIDAEAGAIYQYGQRRYGIWLSNYGPTWPSQDPYVKNYYYEVGGGYYMNSSDDTDAGGVSLSNGMALASDRGGNLIQVPSSRTYTVPVIPPTAAEEYPRPAWVLAAPLGPMQIYPNPFYPATAQGGTIKFRNLPEGTRVELYTLAHERVKIVYVLAGSGYRTQWDGRNEAGQSVASGVYLYRIVRPDQQNPITGRIALVRK